MDNLKYPIGQFIKPAPVTKEHINQWINDIKLFPERVKKEVEGLTKEELHWTYRTDGWSIQQLVHHCADSHINCFMRFKLAVTEEKPTIKPYMENRWANLPDTLSAPIDWSLDLLTGLHARWAFLLESFTKDDLNKSFIHPEHGAEFTVEESIGSYSWHCNHHLAHMRQAIKYKGQFD